MYCPITGGLCEHRKPKLKTCFLRKFTENFGRDVRVEYICTELSKYIFRGTYTIIDLSRTFKEISQEVREESFRDIHEYIKTLPCNLTFTYIVAENMLRLPLDFIETSKTVYLSQSSNAAKKLVKTCIFYTELLANKILTELFELTTTLIDLQVLSSSSVMKHALPYLRLYYVINNMVTIPLYMLYLRCRKNTQQFRVLIEAIAEDVTTILPLLELRLAYPNPDMLDEREDLFSLVLQVSNSILDKLAESSDLNIVKKLHENTRMYYLFRRELLQIDLSEFMLEILRKVDPSLIESPFNIYLLLSLLIEERVLLRLAKDQICRQYLSDEYTYTFRMYFPINAALDDILTDLVLDLYTLRQDVLLHALLGDRGLQLLDHAHGLKSLVLTPSRKVAIYSLQNILFVHSALLDVLTWAINANMSKLWRIIIDNAEDSRKRSIVAHAREYLIDSLNRVTDMLYIVTYVFYIRREFEELFNNYTSKLTSICKEELRG